MKKTVILTTIILIYLRQTINAQITPDGSLPQNTQVINLPSQTIIDSGTIRGNNLFHSFQNFNVSEGQTVFFNNNSNIANIFSRVTGSLPSNINGSIISNGNANLFLLNPNGLIFGNNARLLVGGSFFGTTANQLNFQDGSSFDVTEPEKSILTISIPSSLHFSPQNSKIIVNNIGHDLTLIGSAFTQRTENRLGLFSSINNAIVLIGNGIIFDGGLITSLGGDIEIGSIKQGNVLLNLQNQEQKLDFSQADALADIDLSNKSLLDSSGITRSGNVFVTGNNLSFSSGSVILNQTINPYKSLISLQARGDIIFQSRAIDSNIPSSIRSESLGNFNGANIQANSSSFVLEDRGQIASQTFGKGNGGNIAINASNISIDGQLTSFSNLRTSISSSSFDEGIAGNINLEAKNINIVNGGNISSGAFGEGDSGNVSLLAFDSINISNRDSFSNLQSIVSTSNFSEGNAGILSLSAKKIYINDGRIDSSTLAQGDSGSIFLNASESVYIQGIPNNQNSPSGIIASADIADESIRNILKPLIELPEFPTGKSGNITIHTPSLFLYDGATIQSSNEGIGDGGNIQVDANNIFAYNFSGFNAITKSGEGGGIELKSDEIIFINSSGTNTSSEGIGNGGNISIEGNSLLVLDHSFVRANAFDGNGGNIAIKIPTVFVSSDSQITASSLLGIDGTVNFSSPPISNKPSLEKIDIDFVSSTQSDIVYGCIVVPKQALGKLQIQQNSSNPNPLLSLPLISVESIVNPREIPSATLQVRDSDGKIWAASLAQSSLCNIQESILP